MNKRLKVGILIFLLATAAFAFLMLPIFKADRSRRDFQKNLKERTSVGELQAWAMNLLAPFQTNTDAALWITVTNLPPALRGLDKWPPTAYIYADSQTRFETERPVPYLKVIYGSAAGHFGVLIAPTNFPSPTSREHVVRYTKWSPGVWFFDGQ